MIIADTHAIVWWVLDRDRLSTDARSAMERGPIGVPVISCLEIAMLAQRGRIELDAPPLQWLESVAALPNVRLLPLDVQLCVTAANLPDPIRDPADRLIVATALQQGVPLVTKDARIHESRIVPTIW